MKTYKLLLGVILSLLLTFANVVQVGGQVAPSPTSLGSTFEQRLAQRKQERKIQLSAQDTSRLRNQCVAAQGKLRSIQNQTRALVTSRGKLYQRIDGKLWVIIGQLKLAEKDTYSLEKQRSTLSDKFTAFQTTAASYQQALDDIVVINCQSDVVGFKALVDTARLYQAQLRTQSADIHNYIVNEIKTTLASYTSDLQGKQ